MMQVSSVISLSSPSFNSYSNSEVAEIAARVVEEFGSEEYYGEEFYFERDEEEESAAGRIGEAENGENAVCEDREQGSGDVEENDNDAIEDDEFEFAFLTVGSELSSPISADEIFHNGQIRPVYPVFNRELFLKHEEYQNANGKENSVRNSDSEKTPAIRLPLRKLFIEERQTTMTMARASSSSSSEADDLEGIPAETYCVWRPKEVAEGRCKKSSSSGSSNSKRWKLKSLLHRSHSDGGKDNFVILSPNNSGRRKSQNEDKVKATPPSSGKPKPTASPPPYSVGEKRRSYLPYRQDLVGIFTNVNGLSKNLQPF